MYSMPSDEAPKFILLDTEAGGGLRMSSDSVTFESVIERLVADDRFTSWEERCEILSGYLWPGDDGLSEERFRSIGDGACRDFPVEN